MIPWLPQIFFSWSTARKVNGKPLWRIRSSASCGPAMSRALANTSASQACGAITVTLIQAEIAGSPVRGSIMWCRFFPACCQTRFVMVEVAMAPGSTFKVVRVFSGCRGSSKATGHCSMPSGTPTRYISPPASTAQAVVYFERIWAACSAIQPLAIPPRSSAIPGGNRMV